MTLDLFGENSSGKPTPSNASPKDKTPDYDWLEMVSAFHKELRRGDVEAVKYWAGFLGKKAESYLISVVLEETSNFNLLEYCQDFNVSLTDKICAFCGTRKKWEQKSAKSYYTRLRQIDQVERNQEIIKTPTPPDDMWRAWKEKDFVALSECLVKYKVSTKKVRNLLYDSLTFGQYSLPVGSWGFHERISLLRLHCFHDRRDDEDFDVMFAEDQEVNWNERPIPKYALDKHTKRGAKLFYDNLKSVRPNTPMPEKLDLRYSGVAPYIWWRVLAYDQHGTIDVPWEDVEYPKNQFWNLVMVGKRSKKKK